MKFVTQANWVICAGVTAAGFLLAPLDFALGIFFGGILVTANFHLLAKTLHRAFSTPYVASHNVVIAKYYVRFLITGFAIFLLIAGRVVDPVGLVIGLSVVVFSIILATMREIKKLIFEEAV